MWSFIIVLHSGFIEQCGHPIYCELLEFSSPTRAAATHYPVLWTFTRLLYFACKCHMTIVAIDSALSSPNIDELHDTFSRLEGELVRFV